MSDPIQHLDPQTRQGAGKDLPAAVEPATERRLQLQSRLEALLRGPDIAAEVCRAIHPAWHSANVNRRRDGLH